MSEPIDVYEDLHGISEKVGGLPKVVYLYITISLVAVTFIVIVIILAVIASQKTPFVANKKEVIPYSYVGLPLDAYIPNLSVAEAYGGAEYYADSNLFEGKVTIYNLEGNITTAHLQIGNDESFSKIVHPLEFKLDPNTQNYICEFKWTDHDVYYPLSNECKYNIEKNNLYLEVITDLYLDGEVKGRFQVVTFT